MDLSVVIVNYNVRHFLENALRSVVRAKRGMDVEVFVVDNASIDGSVAVLREKFPWVKVIANDHNPGFSVANNQAIRSSRGKYVLLLNPDTVVEEDTFRKCFDFAERHPRLGALGVRMIDGGGRFLPESKRSLPVPWVAFTKAFGLSRLFPRSRLFNRYHLGYLNENEAASVEVLAGAFMWLRRTTLEEVGLLDETFFMYGEDIDLSYRITQAGYENWYFPDTSIIHYKGESTKRGSLNYVKTFYQAMMIFARKHFTGGAKRSLLGLMQLAIYVRATLTVLGNLWSRLHLVILDGIGLYGGLTLLKTLWAGYHFNNPDYYDDRVMWLHFPAYTLLWLGGIFLSGGYDRPFELSRLFRGLGVSTLLLLAIYGLLPGELRPSRALLLLGAVWATGWTLCLRYGLHFLRFQHLRLGSEDKKRLLIIGREEEGERTLHLLRKAGVRRNLIGRIDPERAGASSIGTVDRLPELARLYRAEEVIFCSADLPLRSIQRWMTELGPQLQYKILPEASNSIIGSHRSDRRGTLYTIDVSLRIDEPTQRRGKWLFNKGTALLLLLSWPFSMWLCRDKVGLLVNVYRVLKGERGWVGYETRDERLYLLPKIRPGVVGTAGGHPGRLDQETLHHLNLLYARDYRVGDDLRLMWSQRRELGKH